MVSVSVVDAAVVTEVRVMMFVTEGEGTRRVEDGLCGAVD